MGLLGERKKNNGDFKLDDYVGNKIKKLKNITVKNKTLFILSSFGILYYLLKDKFTTLLS